MIKRKQIMIINNYNFNLHGFGKLYLKLGRE